MRKISAYIWCEEELDSRCRSFQCQSSDEEDSEDQIWQSGGNVNSLTKDRVIKMSQNWTFVQT